MTNFNRLLSLASLAIALALPAGSLAQQASPAVQQVVAIDTNGKTDVILGEAEANKKIFERLGINATRSYMQASLAGPNTGTFIVIIEYPSLSALAAAQEKLANDADWQKYIDKIIDAGMIIESNSIWVELTP